MQFKKSLLSVAISTLPSMMTGFVCAQETGNAPSNSSSAAAGALEEVSVLGEYIPDEKRETSEISEVFEAEDFATTGDGVVGDALQRLPGLSLVGGKYIYVRGLGERYSSTLFNGSIVSSPVPLQKTVPMDVFPSSVVGSVLVQKTYSPEYSGDFSGGLIVIRSKNLPDNDFFSIGGSLSGDSETTTNDGFRNRGGQDDSYGQDDGTRQQPLNIDSISIADFNDVAADDAQNVAFVKSFYNNWEFRTEENPVNKGFNISAGKLLDLDNGLSLGALVSYDYSDDWKNRSRVKNRFQYGSAESTGDLSDELIEETTQREVGANTLVTLGANYDPHEFTFTHTKLRQTTDDTVFQLGRTELLDQTVGSYRYQWVENEIITNQLVGDHWLLDETFNVRWRVMGGEARRDSPDTRTYSYFLNRDNHFTLLTLNEQIDSTQAFGTPARTYSELLDDIQDYGLDMEWNVLLGDMDVTFRAGGALSERERNTARRQFEFDIDNDVFLQSQMENIFNPLEGGYVDRGLVTVEDRTRTAASVGRFPFAQSSEEVEAGYFSVDAQILPRVRARLGLRSEIVDYTSDAFINEPGENYSDRRESNVLPAFSTTIEFVDNMQIRLSYSETVNRPSLSEITNNIIRNLEDSRLYRGNPDLLIANITNYDLRYEWYFGDADIFTIGAFYKEFDNPIEQALLQAQDEIFTYVNGDSAELQGLEFDITFQIMDSLSAQGNVSLIDSEVVLGNSLSTPTTTVRDVHSNVRQMRGQSDILSNFRLTHQLDWIDWTNTLVYNFTGDRISVIGALNAPDVVEEARGQLDFISRLYTSWNNDYEVELSFKIKNITDDEITLKQGDNLYEAWNTGRSVSFGIDVTF